MRYIKDSWRVLAVLLLAVALTFALACGDDDDDDDGGEPTTAAATTPAGDDDDDDGGELLTDHGVTDTEIIIGQTNDVAGTGGTPYGIITSAMRAYFAKVNAEDGGVCGREINLIAEDDGYDPAQTTERTRKLVEQDDILAMVGALGTATHLAVVDYLNDPNEDGDTSDGVPDLFVSTGYSGWGDYEKWPWTTGFIPDYRSDAAIQATYIVDNFPDAKVGVLYQNDAFGQDYVDGLEEVLGDMIVGEQPVEASATDVSSQLLNLQNAGADSIFLGVTPRPAAQAFGAAEASGYEPQFFNSYVNAATSLASLIGGGTDPDQMTAGFAVLEGTISTNYILDAVADADTPELTEHARILDEYDGGSLSTLSVYSQSLAELATHVLEIACENGDMTRAGLLAAAESVTDFHPTTLLEGIDITLASDDHYAIQALLPVQIQADGTLEPVADAPIAAE